MMSFSTIISNRFVAIVMAMLIPFCCCTLDLCAQSVGQETVASCCCGPVQDSCPDQEQAPTGACLGCIKAPANPAPNFDTAILADMPINHPAEEAISPRDIISHDVPGRDLARMRDEPGSDPGTSARVLRCLLTPQV